MKSIWRVKINALQLLCAIIIYLSFYLSLSVKYSINYIIHTAKSIISSLDHRPTNNHKHRTIRCLNPYIFRYRRDNIIIIKLWCQAASFSIFSNRTSHYYSKTKEPYLQTFAKWNCFSTKTKKYHISVVFIKFKSFQRKLLLYTHNQIITNTFSCTFSIAAWCFATIVSVPSLTDIRAPVLEISWMYT